MVHLLSFKVVKVTKLIVILSYVHFEELRRAHIQTLLAIVARLSDRMIRFGLCSILYSFSLPRWTMVNALSPCERRRGSVHFHRLRYATPVFRIPLEHVAATFFTYRAQPSPGTTLPLHLRPTIVLANVATA